MPCNNCNQPTCNGCHAEVHICNQCPPEQPCDCPIIDLSSDCILYNQDPIECNDVVVVAKDTILSDALKNIVDWTCTRLADIQNFFTLKSVGAGAAVYKGVNLIGEKEIKSLTKTGDLVIITPSTNEINFTIDEDELTNFVNDLLPTPTNVCVQSETLAVTEEEECFNVELAINSNTLTVTNPSPGVFQVEQPASTIIPALYVNTLFEPTYSDWVAAGGNLISNPSFEYKGTGSLAKPFTNTVRYTSAIAKITTSNTAIQNALDDYLGGQPLISPLKSGQKIIVQDNNVGYTFPGNFNYNYLNIKLEANVNSTTTGFLLDLETLVTPSANVIIEIGDNIILEINGNGLRNNGNIDDDLSPYTTGKSVVLRGENGTIYSAVNNITKYIINSDVANLGNNNDGNVTFAVYCKLRADFQGVYHVGGASRVDFFNILLSGTITNTVNEFLRAFHQTGGQVRMFNSATINFEGALVSPRRYAVTLRTDQGYNAAFIGFGNSFSGQAETLFFRDGLPGSNSAILEVTNSSSGYGLGITDVFLGSQTNWSITFKDNTFYSGRINQFIDITNSNSVSSINTIGNRVIESLVQYPTKEAARAAGLVPNSAFLLVKDVNAVDLEAGVEYKIITPGSPSLGTINTYLTATGSETGTGVGRLIKREVLL